MQPRIKSSLLVALGVAVGSVLTVAETGLADGAPDGQTAQTQPESAPSAPTQPASQPSTDGRPSAAAKAPDGKSPDDSTPDNSASKPGSKPAAGSDGVPRSGSSTDSSQGADSKDSQNDSQSSDSDSDKNLPLDELRQFSEILNRVKQGYVENISDQKLLDNAIHGMVDNLDPHSAYLDKQEFKELTISTSGKFGGLGLKVQLQNSYLKVIAPIDGTPAAKAGIKPGDLIIRVDDKPVENMSFGNAVKAMRGKPGSKVSITLLRKDADKPIHMTLTRADIQVDSVNSHMLDSDYGYIRITQFTAETADGMTKALDSLEKQANGKLKGVVLDLRNNPGGVLNAAVSVSDDFINSGPIVSIRGRAPGTDQHFNATAGDRLNGAPMVILVNQGTASAAEIVSGALQDDHRAVIMGTRTFGKGSVQTVIPLASGGALKLTTARYYTPSGRSIQAEGIVPDVALQSVKISPANPDEGFGYSESDLPGALKNTSDTAQKDKARNNAEADNARDSHLAEKDYGVYEALNLLRGINTLQPATAANDEAQPDAGKPQSESAPDANASGDKSDKADKADTKDVPAQTPAEKTTPSSSPASGG